MRTRFLNRKRSVVACVVASFVLLLHLGGCKPEPKPDPGTGKPSIQFVVPANWPAPVYDYSGNPLTDEGFELGRQLFYDVRLSRDNSISCGSCHQAFSAFAQLDHPISHGVDDRLGTRNSPPLFNLNWHSRFFWDGGVNHIELQPLSPITNPLEMDESLDNIVAKLQSDEKMRSMFKDAFGTEEINSQRMFKAMAQFMGTMVSSGSKYDKYMRNEPGVSLTQQERQGMSVFEQKCATCHPAPLFTDLSFRNNGLALLTGTDGKVDLGRGTITNEDSGSYYKFKVPSLRNLRYTRPYMHDGRFATIDEVLDHYTNGIHATLNLDPLLTGGIALTPEEKSDLKAFLSTLDDEDFVRDRRFHEP